MCGRYVVAYDPDTLVSGFSLTRVQPFDRRWNVAPTAMVPVVYEAKGGGPQGDAAGDRVAELMRWGLVPHWAKDESIGARLNNARSEGMADKPSFRQAVRKRRCLLPASGFYEWQTLPAAAGARGRPVKQPWYISPREAPCFAMAGLFEAWRPPGAAADAPWLLTCCVITTAPNAVMAPIHDRMPVMVPPEHWSAWLSRELQDADALTALMQGLPEGAMQAWPVARAVGRSSAEGAQLIEPLADVSDADA